MYNFVDTFAKKARGSIFLLIIIILCGAYAYRNISKEHSPDISFPVIKVWIQNTGISPEDAEIEIVKPMESAFKSLNGLKNMESHAVNSGATIILEFFSGVDEKTALSDVRGKVEDNQHKLPSKAKKAKISTLSSMFHHTITVLVKGDIPLDTLYSKATDLKDRLRNIAEIDEISFTQRDKIVTIELSPGKMAKYKLSYSDVAAAVSQNNRMMLSGSLVSNSGENTVKVPMLIQSVDEFRDIPISKDGNRVINVSDIASVKYGLSDASVIERADGVPSVRLSISKRPGANIMKIIEDVKSVVKKESRKWPQEITALFVEDESKDVQETLSDLENGILLAGLLVVVVIMLSIGVRPALLIAMSIPASFLASILILYISGTSLNIVILFSLILTVGMVVDDAIVVGEYAKSKMQEGVKPITAFCEGAKRMFIPIMSSTLVKIVAFMPLLFWPGMLGQFMMYMPITVIIVLCSSFVFSILFQPALGVALYGFTKRWDVKSARSNGVEEKSVFNGLFRFYEKVLEKAVNNPKHVFIAVITLLAAIFIIFKVSKLGVEFFPEVEQERLAVFMESDGDLSIEHRSKIVREAEEMIRDGFSNSIKSMNTSVMQGADGTIGKISLELIEWDKREKSTKIMNEIRKLLATMPGVTSYVLAPQGGPKGDWPISFEISGRDYNQVSKFADNVQNFMKDGNGFLDVGDSRPFNSMQWQILLDKAKARYYGIDTEAVAGAVGVFTSGYDVSSYKSPDSEDTVRVVLRFEDRYRNIDDLKGINIKNNQGTLIPIEYFAKIVPVLNVGDIRHFNGERSIAIHSNISADKNIEQQVNLLSNWLEQNIPDDLTFKMKGDIENQAESAQFLLNAFFIVILMMICVMIFQFNSFYHTVVIMSAAVLSTGGVLLGLLLSLQPFGIVMCGLGVIALLGLVLNNNILLVDTYQHIRRQGYSSRDAAIMSAKERVRPVMMTAVTAILGLLPLIVGLTINFVDRTIIYDAPSSQWWRQLSASIAGGLGFATLLSLVLTPVLLSVGGRFDKFMVQKGSTNDKEA